MLQLLFWGRVPISTPPSTDILRSSLFFFLAELHGMWDLSSPTRYRTHTPCIGSVES